MGQSSRQYQSVSSMFADLNTSKNLSQTCEGSGVPSFYQKVDVIKSN